MPYRCTTATPYVYVWYLLIYHSVQSKNRNYVILYIHSYIRGNGRHSEVAVTYVDVVLKILCGLFCNDEVINYY